MNCHSAQPPRGLRPATPSRDRALVADLLSSEAAGLVAHVPVAELLDADSARFADLGLEAAARREPGRRQSSPGASSRPIPGVAGRRTVVYPVTGSSEGDHIQVCVSAATAPTPTLLIGKKFAGHVQVAGLAYLLGVTCWGCGVRS